MRVDLGDGFELVTFDEVPDEQPRRFASLAAMHDELAHEWDEDRKCFAADLHCGKGWARLEVTEFVPEPNIVLDCQLCGHPYAQKHRLIPGRWGGTYHPSNVAHLCPNHHAMIHLRMKYYIRGADGLTDAEAHRLDHAMLDPGISGLWADRVKRIMIQRSIDKGIYEPI